MKKIRSAQSKFLTLVLVLALCLAAVVTPAGAATTAPTQQQAYERMIALKSEYPEGKRWTNDNFYAWNGGVYSGGYGCAGFAFILSDAAFGDLPARVLEEFTYTDVKVGDILRINHDTHSVIVLEVQSDRVVVAEGNYNSSIHWGRTLTKAKVEEADYIMTRYPKTAQPEPEQPAEPEKPVEQPPETPAAPTFSDVPAGEYFTLPVAWAVSQGITNGRGVDTFAPYATCNNQEIIVMLWRAAGSPVETTQAPVAADYFAAPAVSWAYAQGIIDGSFQCYAACTRATAVTWIWRAKGAPAGGTASFGDVPAEYAAPVAWAVQKGVTYGTDVDTFSPNDICSRAQIVTFLYRAYAI